MPSRLLGTLHPFMIGIGLLPSFLPPLPLHPPLFILIPARYKASSQCLRTLQDQFDTQVLIHSLHCILIYPPALFSLFSFLPSLSSLFSLLSSLSSLLHALLLIFKNKVHGGVSGLLAHVYPGMRLPKKIIKLQDSIHKHFLLYYSDHEWHSKKFRSNIARWDKVSQEKYMAYPLILLMFVCFLF